MYIYRVFKLFLFLYICVYFSGLFLGVIVLNLLKVKFFFVLGIRYLVDVRLKMGNSYYLGSF